MSIFWDGSLFQCGRSAASHTNKCFLGTRGKRRAEGAGGCVFMIVLSLCCDVVVTTV